MQQLDADPRRRPCGDRGSPRRPAATLRLVLAVWLVASAAGCWQQEPVRRYRVPRPVRGEPTHRMLAATVLRGDEAWFFKAAGREPEVGGQAASIRDWIASVRFSEKGQPEWDLPEGWEQLPGSQLRFATLKWPDASADADVSVTRLPRSGDEQAYVLSNINRWREQLQLPAISPDQLPENSESIALASGTATLVDLRGWSPSAGAARSEGAGGTAGGAGELPGGEPASVAMEYDVPEGWSPGQMVVSRGGITIRYEAAFDIAQGQEQVQVTVSRLPAMGGLAGNVNRWRNQVGLESLDGSELESQWERIEISGGPATYVRALGPEQAVVGAVAPRGSQTWYFKMIGPSPLVEQQESNLRAFLASVRIPD